MSLLSSNPPITGDKTAGKPDERPIEDRKLSVDDQIKFLDEDDKDMLDLTTPLKEKGDKQEKKTDKEDSEYKKEDTDKKDEEEEKKDDQEEEVDELKELEEELEEVDEEKLELITPVARRQILKKYPQLFKDFPYLEKAYYRDREYTQLLPTIDDAKEAVAKATTLDNLEDDLINNANTEGVLKLMKEHNPNGFARMADNYLSTLEKIDPAAHNAVLGNVIKGVIRGLVNEAKESSDDDYRVAALLVNKFIFGSSKLEGNVKLAKEEDPKAKADAEATTKRNREFVDQQLNHAQDVVHTKVNNTLKSTIEGNIDPNKTMNDYLRKTAVENSLNRVNNLLEKDSRFKAVIDKLWLKAAKANFSPSSVDEIRKATLSRVKPLLLPVIKAERAEALKGIAKSRKVNDDIEENDQSEKDQQEKPERRRSSIRSDGKSKEIPKGMSTFDFLNQD